MHRFQRCLKRMRPALWAIALWTPMTLLAAEGTPLVELFSDQFDTYAAGPISYVVGAHTEYHFLPEAMPRGPWEVTAFRSDRYSQRGWVIVEDAGRRVLANRYQNRMRHTHPMVVAGDALWRDYVLDAQLNPETPEDRAGVIVRYVNDRCYYFFGVEGQRAVLLKVNHETAFRVPDEQILAEAPIAWEPGEWLPLRVQVTGSRLEAEVPGKAVLHAEDEQFTEGRVALLADGPASFAGVRVQATPEEARRVAEAAAVLDAERRALQAANPRPVLWKKLRTDGFGVGRNVRFGDLDGDGQIDVLFGQMQHHGPRDSNSELSCLTAMTLDGERLWQVGEPDHWRYNLTNDVAFQIHDLDGDGKVEVIYTMGMELIVAEGATGRTLRKIPTPETPPGVRAPYNRFPRILGDSLFFCDLRGTGRASDLILKDRYTSLWAFDERLQPLWQAQCNTGHYPHAADIDGDGRDEVIMGYTLFDHDGTVLWSLDDTLQDHADAVAWYRPAPGAPWRLYCAASDEGLFFADTQGNILKHHRLGHVQNSAIGEFRTDLPGLEIVSVNFWGNQGIIHLLDAEGEVYHSFEPFQHGSMCLPVNWTGQAPEYVMLSPNTETGGMIDGHGRQVVTLPADGHPEMCYDVLDLTGDCRDEIVVWDPFEMWVYTQDDNPKPGTLYQPTRNPLYNASNYFAVVSLPPDWAREAF